jgi:hypothetical protein
MLAQHFLNNTAGHHEWRTSVFACKNARRVHEIEDIFGPEIEIVSAITLRLDATCFALNKILFSRQTSTMCEQGS